MLMHLPNSFVWLCLFSRSTSLCGFLNVNLETAHHHTTYHQQQFTLPPTPIQQRVIYFDCVFALLLHWFDTFIHNKNLYFLIHISYHSTYSVLISRLCCSRACVSRWQRNHVGFKCSKRFVVVHTALFAWQRAHCAGQNILIKSAGFFLLVWIAAVRKKRIQIRFSDLFNIVFVHPFVCLHAIAVLLCSLSQLTLKFCQRFTQNFCFAK